MKTNKPEQKRLLIEMMKEDEKHGMYDAPIKVTEKQLGIIDSSEILKLNENFFIRKERCLEILQKWDDKLNTEKIQPLQARIAELEAELEKERQEGRQAWEKHQVSLIEDLEKQLSDTKANLGRAYNGIRHRDEQIRKYKEYCQRNGLEGF